MNSGSSQDTTWTSGGAVAAPAAGESTADDAAMQSIDSSTEEDKARHLSCYPKDSSQSEELVKSFYAFAPNIHRIEDNKRQRSGK